MPRKTINDRILDWLTGWPAWVLIAALIGAVVARWL